MIKNYFYFIVGLLCVLFAVTHTLNGMSTVLPLLDETGIASGAKVTFTYVWHVIGIENLIFGVALLVMSFYKDMAKTKFTTWLIIIILALRWITISMVSLIGGISLGLLIGDTIAIFVVILLLLFGLRVKNK